ncbi:MULTISPECIES: hypothetical protein [Clostridia]|uniref:Uncharacterized protein n=1 Tax=Lacrimispora celerecrescens TaxID=29354 RepID=A0A084JP67_9FIRM|nr:MULTISPECIES: hypothetical protein [Clostridia]KEZ90751.1 hypothetical protein IO98_08450 [Lacrimispora celerecrescens]MBW4848070.1 hypothetical protein [Lachnospiraceae bacterium]MSS09378.1 hypothetical protein [Clostridium sp. WB02_MRS01]HBG11746.1 hypothetical protein [Clostridium sp.]
MKVKSKRIVLSLISMALSLSALPMEAYAQDNKQQLPPIAVNSQENSQLLGAVTYAQVIGWRYKTEDGKVYRRQYNYSRQKWIGEWELC